MKSYGIDEWSSRFGRSKETKGRRRQLGTLADHGRGSIKTGSAQAEEINRHRAIEANLQRPPEVQLLHARTSAAEAHR